ncbi:MAG: type II toxin-antitoxin system VapC family toxin [Verrucomicrobia bacterium]|jgi:predicted nucleic acid-binding protein|nr:type II toxin-antitoxin system VapC family toxin [Verrucomicrobiota bacterium]
MIAVVDTSAVLRLFIPDGPIPDGLEAFFRGVESGTHVAIAPELLIVEATNVVVKKQRRGELSVDEATELVSLLEQLPIRYFSHHTLYSRTHELAMETGLSAYDALFLALALDRGTTLFTADDRLQREAAARGILSPRTG